jgi:hypothetical protein
VPSETFDEIEKVYAPCGDPVFDLVPFAFAVHANAVWTAMGSPQPQFDNAWEIYLRMCDALRVVTQPETLQQILSSTDEPQNVLGDIPEDLRPMESTDEDEPLVVDISDSDGEGSILVDLTEDDEDCGEDADSEGHGMLDPL